MTVDTPNLERPMDLDLAELRRALPDAGQGAERAHVVVQVCYPSGIFKRYWLEPEGARLLRAGRMDPKARDGTGTLREFVDEVATSECAHPERCFRAGRKALVLWGHGVGVAESMEPPLPPQPWMAGSAGSASVASLQARAEESLTFASSYGASVPTLSIGGAGGAMQQLKDCSAELDIVGFDACFMSMIEILFDLGTKVRYVLAPQTSISLQGWHYDLLLDHILYNDATLESPRALGEAAVQQVGLRSSSPQSLTLLDLSGALELRDAFQDLVGALVDATSGVAEMNLRHQLLGAFEAATWVGARQFLDLADLCRHLASRIPVEGVRVAARGVLKRLHELVVDQLTTLNVPLGGVSVYCPWVRATAGEVNAGSRNAEVDLDAYRALEFVQSTGYARLLFHPSNLVPAERRWVRREVADCMRAVAAEGRTAGGIAEREPGPKPACREPDPKPAGREPDPKPARREPGPKPAEREPGPKPATRGPDPKPARRGPDPKPAGRGPGPKPAGRAGGGRFTSD